MFCGIILLFSSFKTKGQDVVQQLDKEQQIKSELKINLPFQVFFKDNEYKRKIAYGYTLGGFRLKPNLEYQLNERFSFALGINALRYWGANEYGSYNFVSVPYYSDTNTQGELHFKPYFRATYKPNSNLTFIMGNLDNSSYHYLNAPLYNTELLYSSDDEEGLQLIYQSKHLVTDIWFNLQNFNFYNDIDRESLLVGISGYAKFPFLKTNELRLNYAFMWQHHGGELDTLDLPLDHWTNMRLGVDYYKYFDKNQSLKHINIGVDYYYAKALRNDTWYFSSGYAYYPHINIQSSNIQFGIGYFYSKDFTSLYGNAFYSNVAQRDENIYYPHNKMLTMDFAYRMDFANLRNYRKKNASKYNLYLFTEFYYKMDDSNSVEKETKSLSMAFGVRFCVDNSFHLTSIVF